MSDTTRLKLPLIAAQQAQKHVTHNEALLKLDVLVQATVLDRDLNTPPASPAEGDAFIVAASATGDWAGQDGNIAVWQNGGWVFHAPSEGWKVWVADEDALYVHDGTAWVRFETGITSVNPVPDGKLGINATADNTNRLAVKSDAVLFSHDDVTPGSGDVQFKVNKAAATNTASLLFQTGWSGRAELGLAGSDDLQVKVSADGNSWRVALQIAATTGHVGMGKAPDGSGMLDVGGAICCGRQTGAFGTGSSGYTAFVLGQPGEGGALYAISRADPTKSPFTGLCGWDNGSVMNLYFGGGNWGVPDATNLYFYTAPSYSDSPNTGVARLLINSNGDTLPVSDNAYALGNAGQRWRDIYSANPVTTTSDARLKKDINDCSLGLEFIRRLRPVSFRWKEGRLTPVPGASARAAKEPGAHQPETAATPGRRRHFGLLAQQVRETLGELGEEDFAGWLLEDRNDENSRQGLRYAEFIAPMIRAIQELADELDALKASRGESWMEDGHAGE